MMSVMVITIITIVILVTNVIILNDKGAESEAEIPYGETIDGRIRNPKMNPVLSQLSPLEALTFNFYNRGKDLPQQAEVVQGVPGRLRPWNFLTFGTTRVAGRQPYAPVAFTPREIPGTHF